MPARPRVLPRRVAARPYGKQMDASKKCWALAWLQQNLTQEEVAEKMNVSVRTITRLVANSRNLAPFEVSFD